MRKIRLCLVLAVLLGATVALAGCGGGNGQEPAGEGAPSGTQAGNVTITFGVTPWTSTVPPTYIAKNILEDMGYKVKLQEAEVGVVYAGLSTGDIDVFMDSWLPDTHKTYMEEYGADIEKVAMSYPDGDLGWVVPTYVEEINSIADLQGREDLFEGQIIGIDPGAGMMETSAEIISGYDLDLELVEGSEAAMMTQVKAYYPQQKPILFLGWRPHSMFAQYDLKILEDPKGYWKTSEVWVLANKDFKDKAPEAYQALQKWHIDVGEVEEMILAQEVENADPDALARQWMEEHQDQVQEMMGQ